MIPFPAVGPPGHAAELRGGNLDNNEKHIEDHEKAAQVHSPSGTSRDDSTDAEMGIDKEHGEEVRELARRMSHISTRSGEATINPFEGSTDPRYDPNSGSFNAEAWVRSLIKITSRDPERYPGRTAGVSFRNLSVHGWGTPTDYQKDVANILLEGVAWIRKLIGQGGQRKIQILENFDGVVNCGEMLVVLGRPGRYSFLSILCPEVTELTHGQWMFNATEDNCWRDPWSVRR